MARALHPTLGYSAFLGTPILGAAVAAQITQMCNSRRVARVAAQYHSEQGFVGSG
jgi:hypothetical protein